MKLSRFSLLSLAILLTSCASHPSYEAAPCPVPPQAPSVLMSQPTDKEVDQIIQRLQSLLPYRTPISPQSLLQDGAKYGFGVSGVAEFRDVSALAPPE
jgi:hypothetical protein